MSTSDKEKIKQLEMEIGQLKLQLIDKEYEVQMLYIPLHYMMVHTINGNKEKVIEWTKRAVSALNTITASRTTKQ